jgi:hypothetical protein
VPYNSALKGPVWAGRDDLAEIEFAESPAGMVFAHNVCDPMPEPFIEQIAKRAECIYAELPWPAGGDTFYARAGVEARPHDDFMFAVKGRIVDPLGKPTFIVASKRDARFLASDDIRPITHRGGNAWLAASGGPAPRCETSEELIAYLAGAYRSVYDFSCGYGRSLRPFAFFIGSDIDRKCLAYVARELL